SVVIVGWEFFRAETLTGAFAFLTAMAGRSTATPAPLTVGYYLPPELWLALVAGFIGSMPWAGWVAARRDRRAASAPAFEILSVAALVTVFVASVLQLAARTYNPFIYF